MLHRLELHFYGRVLAHLQVVRQLRAACVTGVHGHKDATRGDEADVLAKEDEALAALLDGLKRGSAQVHRHMGVHAFSCRRMEAHVCACLPLRMCARM